MISGGSCDIEAWSSDAEIQLCHHRNKLNITCIKCFKMETVIVSCNYIL